MKKRTIQEYKTTVWQGGATTELMIFPENADYSKREFLYRISSAAVESETSDFTKLDGVNRKLMILDGEMSLSHNGAAYYKLKPFCSYAFSGEDETKSKGKCVDFNLMLKNGTDGEIEKMDASMIKGVVKKQAEQIFLYLYQGSMTIEQQTENGDRESLRLLERESCLLCSDSKEIIFQIQQISEDAIGILCCIKFL